MFEIDRLHVVTKLEDKKISEEKYYAIFGNNALELNKKLFVLNKEDLDASSDLLDVYYNHLVEARALTMKDHLIVSKDNLDSFIQKNDLIRSKDYDKYAYKRERYGYEYIDEGLVNNYIQTAIHFLDSELIKQSMIKLDKLAYYKAQKLLWEEKINDELSRREQEQIDKESDESEE